MTILISTFFTIFLLAFQQQNVHHEKYLMAAITSVGIAYAQYAMIDSVAHGGSWVLMGLGGAIGVTSAMWAHKNIFRKKPKPC